MQRSFQPVMTTIVLSAAMLLACVPASAAVLTLDDNGTHDLNSAVAEDHVYVENSTTANLLAGGSIGEWLWAYDDSTVTIFGTDWGLSGGLLRQHGDRLRRARLGAIWGRTTTAR